MFGEISLVLQDIIVAIVIFLTSFLPSDPEKLTVDASAVTSQSVEMVFEYKNETGHVIDRPTIMKISEKTEDGWKSFYENDVIIEEPYYVMPGKTGSISRPVEYYYGKPTLEPGEYSIEIAYRVHEKNEVNYVHIEVPFTVV